LQNLRDDIKSRDFKRVYLLFGNENYIKKKCIKELKEKVISKDLESMNLDIFQEKKIEARKIFDACKTVPFMNEFRLVIVKDSELFIQGSKNESEKAAENIKNIPDSSILVFIEDNVDKRGKLYKAVLKNGSCIECKTPSEREMIDWVLKFSAENGIKMSKNVALYFIRNINSGMETAVGEIKKLLDYVGKGGRVSEKDIDAVCTKSLEVKIFDMVAAIGNKKTTIALDIYNNMILTKEAPIMILAMIARQFRLILQSKYLSEKGLYKSEIAKKINQREFVISECLVQSKNFKKKVLLQALDDCLKCDIDIKTGKLQDKLGVEMLIMKYSQ